MSPEVLIYSPHFYFESHLHYFAEHSLDDPGNAQRIVDSPYDVELPSPNLMELLLIRRQKTRRRL
jgi:hypothetical protein